MIFFTVLLKKRGAIVKMDALISLIEDARRKLNDSAKSKSLTDPEIVNMSQCLDRLLNEYYLMKELGSLAS
ncbi:aspartyl-phosphate phosphatase Spo0E family protein [Desulfosporosinus sp. FKA]|uniref:aspartyl-phosphate phosphatase Spo0E family protein n=1 Tax=Desulfosporosinus sp. FKA TaxID=1969834 RepID=UPI001FA89914|nr:aspartyl-phosphate phosphatase Spo0E family protein [Desulfosporosinus sp. FKA]